MKHKQIRSQGNAYKKNKIREIEFYIRFHEQRVEESLNKIKSYKEKIQAIKKTIKV